MKLALELDRERVVAGERVVGRIHALEGGPSRSLTIMVGFHERSPGYAATPYASGGVVHQGDLATGQVVDFHFSVPEDAPPSVEGKNTRLYWEVEARADSPGFDASARQPFEVVAP